LGVLLLGLDSIDRPHGSFPPPLRVRATNCLLRARITSWSVLAGWTAADVGHLPRVGVTTLEEILRVAIQEWAGFHLGDGRALDPSEIYDGLVALSVWGASTRGTHGAVAAIAAATEAREELPRPVAQALRALRRIGASEEQSRGGLKHAFAELEATPGFSVFRQRQLEGSTGRPTFRELAVELGVSHSRAGQLEKTFKAKITSQMQEEDWPIRLAVEQLRETLGAVARSDELDEAFADLDPGDTLDLSQTHRRALLLWICEYRTDGEWILGPDIGNLTDVILAAVAKRERAEFDAATRHLTLLGVRDEIQLRWILSRVGYRIVDDQIFPDDG
jgi:hypothetical protein